MKKKGIYKDDYKDIVRNTSLKIINIIFKRGLIRWECLRRDPEYIRSYKEQRGYKNIPTGVLLNPDITDKDIERMALKHKNNFECPEVGFITILGRCMDSSASLFLSPDALRRENVSCKDSVPQEITLKINLNYTKEEIMQAFESEIDNWIENLKYRNFYKKKTTQNYLTIRRYFKVYDLKQKLTYPEIVKQRYSGTKTDSSKEASYLSQVKRERRKADKIIKGGCWEIW